MNINPTQANNGANPFQAYQANAQGTQENPDANNQEEVQQQRGVDQYIQNNQNTGGLQAPVDEPIAGADAPEGANEPNPVAANVNENNEVYGSNEANPATQARRDETTALDERNQAEAGVQDVQEQQQEQQQNAAANRETVNPQGPRLNIVG